MNLINLPEIEQEKKIIVIISNLHAAEIVLDHYKVKYNSTKNISCILVRMEEAYMEEVYNQDYNLQKDRIEFNNLCDKFHITERFYFDKLDDFTLVNLDNPMIDKDRIEVFESVCVAIETKTNLNFNYISAVILTMDKLWLDCYNIFKIIDSIKDFKTYVQEYHPTYCEHIEKYKVPIPLEKSYFKNYTAQMNFSFRLIPILQKFPDLFKFPFLDMDDNDIRRLYNICKSQINNI